MPELATADRLLQLAAGLVPGLVAALVCLWAWSRWGEPAGQVGLGLAAAAAVGVAVAGTPAAPAVAFPVLVAATGVAAAALADFDRRWRDLGLLPALLAVTAAGVWATVPDVEGALALLGAALPMTLLGWPGPPGRRRPPPAFGAAGALLTAALLVGIVAGGGAGRPGSIVGGLACLGLVLVEPVARRLDPRRRSPLDLLERRPRLALAALAAQLALVGAASRVVGRPEGAAPAALLAVAELGLAVAGAVALTRLAWPGQRTPG